MLAGSARPRPGLGARGLHAMRGAPTRSMPAHVLDPLRHGERGLRSLSAAVAYRATRPLPRLLLAECRDHAEGRGHAGRKGDLADPRARLARDVLEVLRLAPTDH